ncbi:MAG: phosphoglycolate phosphatase [Patescibacteria group bacterium]|jgi:HAD superfamily hydrolase (TIGR01549 family)|nr:phosphoglycolate phosphatase [Patescibacteria group bacterium]
MTDIEQLLAKNPKKYIIFDFDETLFTLHLPWHKYYAELARRLYEFDPDFPQTKSVNKLENDMTEKWGRKVAEIRWEYSLQFEKDNLRGVTELTDLTNFIRNNHSQYQFYLWTSNMRETVTPILQKSGLLPYFRQLVTKGDVLLMKPNPEGFEKILESQEHKKADFLMVGNSKNDQKAAEASGIDYWMRP